MPYSLYTKCSGLELPTLNRVLTNGLDDVKCRWLGILVI